MDRIFDPEPQDARRLLPGLAELLIDAVDDGASLGFLRPLTPENAQAYWHDVIGQIQPNTMSLIVACTMDGTVAGSVQLDRGRKENAAHRAEVRKLMVRREFRRRGLARNLMERLQQLAASWGLQLLILDTATGEPAEMLYKNMGYERFGLVPDYACYPDGVLHEVSFYYKRI